MFWPGDQWKDRVHGGAFLALLVTSTFCARVVFASATADGMTEVFVQGDQSFCAGSELCSARGWEMRRDREEKPQWQSTDQGCAGTGNSSMDTDTAGILTQVSHA